MLALKRYLKLHRSSAAINTLSLYRVENFTLSYKCLPAKSSIVTIVNNLLKSPKAVTLVENESVRRRFYSTLCLSETIKSNNNIISKYQTKIQKQFANKQTTTTELNRFHITNTSAAWWYCRRPHNFIGNNSTRSLRHHSRQQQLPPPPPLYQQQQQHLLYPASLPLNRPQTRSLNMGSANCKEYVTTNDACSNRPENENGTTGSGLYQSTCEAKMVDDYTDPVAVCNVGDLQEHEMKQFQFNENTKVLVVKQKDQIKAIGNKCTHYGAPLHTGVLGDGRVRCPWHGACFSIDSGDIEDFPGLDSLPCYKVEVKSDGQVMVRAKRKDLENTRRLKDMVKRDPKDNRCYVVVGGGPAGAVCAETLRQEGFTGRLVMVCKEQYLPYDRVKVSKASDVQIETLQFRKPQFYEEYDIETLMGVAATKLSCEEKILYLSNNTTVTYDKIFIATGCSASKPSIKGSNLKGVMVVREYDDLKEINKLITPESNLVCLGSSFIALEAAQSWGKKAKCATLISRTEFPLMATFGAVVGERVLRLYKDQGIHTVMNSGIVEILGDDNNNVTDVILKDGTKLPCDILIMGTGSKFNTDFLIGSGLPLNHNGSIDTDLYLKTLVDDVYVGGDIANAPVYSHNQERAAIGHYQLAQYHGRIAALNMVGKTTEELRAVPFFFTMLFGKGFRYSGYGKYNDVVIEGDLDNLKFVAYFLDGDDKVVAVASCGRDPIVAQFAELQSQGKTLHRKDLEDPSDPVAWTKKLKLVGKCI
ncbi:apoptosis-inducing factor 3 isoform X2 [Stomoxys calcitrans]|uniref:apoptosis-inducing factor 3 isoform X2 n=1 Tax=Stomoxys calcitrans TaxID=35570 RepID=UPI0027E2F945|nr:apoptosis-inducing factor 3 isoform X2 [Stomoxys calcitrans]